jgi:hypothetical protein
MPAPMAARRAFLDAEVEACMACDADEQPQLAAPSARAFEGDPLASEPASPARHAPARLFRRVADVLGFGDEKRARAAEPAADELEPYRRRAAELAKEVDRGAVGAALLAELGRLALKLDELCEDLASVGAAEALLAPLRALRDEARPLLEASAPDPAAASALLARIVEELERFAAGTSNAPRPKRGSFWK